MGKSKLYNRISKHNVKLYKDNGPTTHRELYQQTTRLQTKLTRTSTTSSNNKAKTTKTLLKVYNKFYSRLLCKLKQQLLLITTLDRFLRFKKIRETIMLALMMKREEQMLSNRVSSTKT